LSIFIVYHSDDNMNFSIFNFPYKITLPTNNYINFNIYKKNNNYLSKIIYSNVTLVN
jgi:hypothetical protein